MRKNVKGVIFDFNGVLFWDTELQEKAWDDFSIKHRGLPFTEEEKVKILHGRPNRIIQEYLLKRQLSDKEIYKYTQEKETAYRALCLNDINSFKLSPGAVKLFNYLLDKNIPHTIATASERGNLDFFIKHLKLDKWFDTDIIVYDNGTFPGKPEPDIFLKAAKNIDLSPELCMVIEDSVSGLKAAYHAGIGTIYALGPKNKHEYLSKIEGVSAVIERVDEVLRF